MDFDFSELNPFGIALGLVGGIVALIVMSKVDVGIFWKGLAFFFSTVAGYAISTHIANKD